MPNSANLGDPDQAAGSMCSSITPAIPRLCRWIRKLVHAQGRVVLVGVPRVGQDIRIHSLPLHFGKLLVGSHGGEAIPQTDIPRYQALYRHGRVRLRELITARFALADINSAIASLRDGRISGRCLITM